MTGERTGALLGRYVRGEAMHALPSGAEGRVSTSPSVASSIDIQIEGCEFRPGILRHGRPTLQRAQ